MLRHFAKVGARSTCADVAVDSSAERGDDLDQGGLSREAFQTQFSQAFRKVCLSSGKWNLRQQPKSMC